MNKIEYIGIVVNNLDVVIVIYEVLLGIICYKIEEVELEGVCIVFFQVGEFKIELLEMIWLDGFIGKFIEKKGEGIYYIVFDVMDI